jgi:hypothetical protein
MWLFRKEIAPIPRKICRFNRHFISVTCLTSQK